MTTPRWVKILARRHGQLVDKKFLSGLTDAEAMEHARIQGLLDAWEAWDCNGTERGLYMHLVMRSLYSTEAAHDQEA